MFNAIKKLASRQDAPVNATSGNGMVANSQTSAPNASCVPMSGSLQRKFAKGVQYNMKIIIKGDRNVGKSCLLERLQGRGFIETYKPSEEIKVASIQWSFKATEDIVKVEVWDVVDRGKARTRQTGLKISAGAPIPETPALDAEFLDVYKGTHGVILMVDITKNWTFEYASKELPKIPGDIPVLLLGNHCDMAHHRVITQGQAIGLIEGLGPRTAEVLYGESSMRNGFGLRLLHKFLSLPFLQLQRETLTALLARNKRDTEVCSIELGEFLTSPDADYNRFLENLVNKRRQIADSNPKNLTHFSSNSMSSTATAANNQSSTNPNHLNSDLRATKSIIIGAGHPIVVPNQPINVTSDTKNYPVKSQLSANVNATLQKVSNQTIASIRPSLQGEASLCRSLVNDAKVTSVEEFCPDGGALDKGFLDDLPNVQHTETRQIDYNCDSDSDSNDTGNPLVAHYHEDPFDDLSMAKNSESTNCVINSQTVPKSEPKVNPLAKNKNKNLNAPDLSVILTTTRRSSNSSEDVEIPHILKTNVNENTSDVQSNEEFDSWLSDTNQRRSPEGGEDEASLPSIDKTVKDSASSQIDRLQVIDNDQDGERKDKNSKNKKKKKDKKDKKEKKEKCDKERKRTKSKKSTAEDLLSERKDVSSHPDRLDADDDQYEAL